MTVIKLQTLNMLYVIYIIFWQITLCELAIESSSRVLGWSILFKQTIHSKYTEILQMNNHQFNLKEDKLGESIEGTFFFII